MSTSTHTIELAKGQSMLDPTSTNGRRIHGPALVTIIQYADGGRDVNVSDLPTDALRDMPAADEIVMAAAAHEHPATKP